MLDAELLYEWELHKAIGSISANVQSFIHEPVCRLGLHVKREAKGKETYDVHSKAFDPFTHVYWSSSSLASFPDLLNEYINLLHHGRFEVSHGLLIDSLPDQSSLQTMLTFVDCIENAGVSRGAGEQVNV